MMVMRTGATVNGNIIHMLFFVVAVELNTSSCRVCGGWFAFCVCVCVYTFVGGSQFKLAMRARETRFMRSRITEKLYLFNGGRERIARVSVQYATCNGWKIVLASTTETVFGSAG